MIRNRYEDYAAGLFRIIARVWGVHPALIPARYWRLFQVAGIDEQEFKDILRSIHSLEAWPEVWQEVGQRHHQSGQPLAAFLAYYIGQRLIIVPNQIKNDLYSSAAQVYMQLEHTWPVEKIHLSTPAGNLCGIYQRTHKTPKGQIMLLPGVTFTKEELHFFAQCFLMRGYHVLRIDHPGYGETEGSLLDHGLDYIQTFAAWQKSQAPSLDLCGFGISFGGWILLQNHHAWDKWVTLCAPSRPSTYYAQLPKHSKQALLTMAGLGYDQKSEKALVDIMQKYQLAGIHQDTALIIHGNQDRTIPVSDSDHLLEQFPCAQAALYPQEGHSCPDKWESIWSLTLNWLEQDMGMLNHDRPWHVPITF